MAQQQGDGDKWWVGGDTDMCSAMNDTTRAWRGRPLFLHRLANLSQASTSSCIGTTRLRTVKRLCHTCGFQTACHKHKSDSNNKSDFEDIMWPSRFNTQCGQDQGVTCKIYDTHSSSCMVSRPPHLHVALRAAETTPPQLTDKSQPLLTACWITC